MLHNVIACRANLFRLADVVKRFLYFVFDPVDGVIGQFIDIEEEQKDFYQEIEALHF